MIKRRIKLFIILINILYVTANKPTVYDEFLENLLKYWNIEENDSLCQLDVNGKMGGKEYQNQPLLIHPNSSKLFHPSERTGIIEMRQNEKIQLFCSTGFSFPTTVKSNSVFIKCMDNGHILLNDGQRFFNNFSCRKHPIHTTRRRVNMNCYNNATVVDVGFEADNKFLITMTLCHDPLTEQTYYAKYRLTPANVASQHGIKRPSFIQSDFFPGKDINLLYSREHQRKIISEFIGSEVLLKKDASNEYLSRGHLAAKGDFIYGNEQRATFYYINVAPQNGWIITVDGKKLFRDFLKWQSFNSLNWRAIEDGTRRLCADRNITLNVYTGTHGIITMNNSKGVQQNIYLDMVNKQIPVPKLFYKILINPEENSGVAIVCANNIHTTIDEIQSDYVVCEDVSDEIKYIKWRKKDIKRGYCYACSVNDFLEKVPHLEGIQMKNLLI